MIREGQIEEYRIAGAVRNSANVSKKMPDRKIAEPASPCAIIGISVTCFRFWRGAVETGTRSGPFKCHPTSTIIRCHCLPTHPAAYTRVTKVG